MTGAGLAALQGGSGSLAAAVRSAFATPGARYLGSLAALAVVAATVAGAYRLGPVLARRLDAEIVEAVQAAVVMAVALAAAGFLAVTWRALDDVDRALAAVDPSPTAGVKLLIVALALGIAYTVTRVTKWVVGLGADRDAISVHQREVLHYVLQIVVFAPAVLFSLRLFGVPPGSLLVSASVLGVVVGLAARQTLGAALAGFVLLFSRPFEVGDWVELHDKEGIVTDVSVVNTRLRTFDNRHVMIPNDRITDAAITNYSAEDWLRVDVDVGVDYGTDVQRAAAVAADAMAACEAVADEPPPDVVVDEFGDSAVVLTLLFWIEEPTIHRKWTARNAVMEAVKAAFDREGIKIPFPQRELAGRPEAGGLRTGGAAVPPSARDGNGDDATATGSEDENEEGRDRPADGPTAGPDREDDD